MAVPLPRRRDGVAAAKEAFAYPNDAATAAADDVGIAPTTASNADSFAGADAIAPMDVLDVPADVPATPAPVAPAPAFADGDAADSIFFAVEAARCLCTAL